MTRKCVSCKEDKPLTKEYFYSDKNRLHGLMYRCKDCDKQRKDNRCSKERWKNFTAEQKQKHYKVSRAYAITPMGRAIALCASYKVFDRKRGYDNDI